MKLGATKTRAEYLIFAYKRVNVLIKIISEVLKLQVIDSENTAKCGTGAESHFCHFYRMYLEGQLCDMQNV